jgi:drug/metabolite transporter (DMT)-like permease
MLILSSVFYTSCALIYASWNAPHIISDIRKITYFDVTVIGVTVISTGFLANLLYYKVLQKHDSHIIVALMNTCPFFTLILAYLFLKEKIKIYGILGVFFILIGVFCLAYNGHLPNEVTFYD